MQPSYSPPSRPMIVLPASVKKVIEEACAILKAKQAQDRTPPAKDK